ncbi:hypothetical protein [uncultured Bacteroides sp.]|uniref:hypothetical protein n=1 Tax=uncultured Bacteroides sp. TaxID=162156 RepID=UPI0026015B76|nr:hypothetical protein [uncultured Bacteroides sp.]
MNVFYFNECLPSQFNGSLQTVFETIIREFNRLTRDKNLKIEKAIITHKIPSEILVCNTNLKKLIDSCNDKELKKIALSYFIKYPIDYYYQIDDIFTDEDLAIKYEFNELDATNLIIAHKMSWFLLSLPLCNLLKQDLIIVKSGTQQTQIHNWYGNNNSYITHHIAESIGSREKNITNLQYCFGNKDCVMSDTFISDYLASPISAQELIIDKFIDAINAHLLFPAKHDDNLVKTCKGIGNEATYELRSKALGGIRVYFSCNETCIYIGGMGTKATSVGKEQTADICRASNEISKIKATNPATKNKTQST